MPVILIYTSSICPYCIMAKRLLDKKGAKYQELKVDKDPELRQKMIQRTQRRTVPQIYIDDLHVGGFDELRALDTKKELDPLLAVA